MAEPRGRATASIPRSAEGQPTLYRPQETKEAREFLQKATRGGTTGRAATKNSLPPPPSPSRTGSRPARMSQQPASVRGRNLYATDGNAINIKGADNPSSTGAIDAPDAPVILHNYQDDYVKKAQDEFRKKFAEVSAAKVKESDEQKRAITPEETAEKLIQLSHGSSATTTKPLKDKPENSACGKTTEKKAVEEEADGLLEEGAGHVQLLQEETPEENSRAALTDPDSQLKNRIKEHEKPYQLKPEASCRQGATSADAALLQKGMQDTVGLLNQKVAILEAEKLVDVPVQQVAAEIEVVLSQSVARIHLVPVSQHSVASSDHRRPSDIGELMRNEKQLQDLRARVDTQLHNVQKLIAAKIHQIAEETKIKQLYAPQPQALLDYNDDDEEL